jgi:hypothetical protein
MGMVTGNVLDAAIDVQTSSIDVSSGLYRQWVPGPIDARFIAHLSPEMQWDKTVTGTTGDPPDILALLALARKHPEEYQQLHEGEQILKALGG